MRRAHDTGHRPENRQEKRRDIKWERETWQKKRIHTKTKSHPQPYIHTSPPERRMKLHIYRNEEATGTETPAPREKSLSGKRNRIKYRDRGNRKKNIKSAYHRTLCFVHTKPATRARKKTTSTACSKTDFPSFEWGRSSPAEGSRGSGSKSGGMGRTTQALRALPVTNAAPAPTPASAAGHARAHEHEGGAGDGEGGEAGSGGGGCGGREPRAAAS